MQEKAKRQGFTPQVPQVASAKGEKMPVLEITDADILFIINTPIRRMTVRQLKAVASYERVKLSRADMKKKRLLCKRIIETRQMRKFWAEAMASYGQAQ